MMVQRYRRSCSIFLQNQFAVPRLLPLLLKWFLNLKFRFDVAKCDGCHSEKEGRHFGWWVTNAVGAPWMLVGSGLTASHFSCLVKRSKEDGCGWLVAKAVGAPWMQAGGGPAAAPFLCFAKERKQRKATAKPLPADGGFPNVPSASRVEKRTRYAQTCFPTIPD